jgi:RNA polymerase sigma-70 factor (ECF subfamily)
MSGFETTRWGTVLTASGEGTERARQALDALCETYWYPLYAYLRRRGHTAEEAEDLTQGFFARILEKGVLRAADPERGRFRSFLLSSLQHYVANERSHAEAQKRGGRPSCLRLDGETAERRYLLEPTDKATPETIFERRWALTVLDRVLVILRVEFRHSGKEHVFDALKGYLVAGEECASGREISAQLGMSEAAVRVAVHRLRRRFGELLRREIAETVSTPEDIQDEIQHLIRAVAR